ncbi:hypothetical protein FXW04_08970 [Staphylococcus pseudintermedius]|nr:hypothetical protein [Staphylococcus pseudintermedius]
MKKVDYEKLYQMRSEIHKLLKDRKSLDVEDLPIETFNPAEGFSELTDEAFEYLTFELNSNKHLTDKKARCSFIITLSQISMSKAFI